MLNRLLVLAQLFLIPLYFVLFSIRWREDIQLFFNNIIANSSIMAKLLPDWLIWFEVYLGIPIFFSLPWIVFTIMRATRIADSYDLMGRALGKVRIDQKLFYGLNAAFTLIFLIFPFLSPIITIFGIFWSVRVIMRKLVVGRISRLSWFVPALIMAVVPGLIAYAFYSNYVILFQQIFYFWQQAIPRLFGIGLSLAIAIALGNFLLFLFDGRKQYGTGEEIPIGGIMVFKIFLFAMLLTIYLTSVDGSIPSVINYINYFAAVAGAFELIVRKLRKMPGEAFSIINIVINFLKEFTNLTKWIQAIVIMISATIFFLLFYLSYSYAPQEFNYPVEAEWEPAAKSSETKTEEVSEE